MKRLYILSLLDPALGSPCGESSGHLAPTIVGGARLYRGSRIAVIVPAFNEGRLIGVTLRSIPPYVDWIIVVDDGSTDDTSSKISQHFDSRIVSARHEINKGVGCAILTGYRIGQSCGADCLAVMAGDNQMDPAQLHRLLDPIIDGVADYTKGNRLTDRDDLVGMSLWRHFGNTTLSIMTKIASGYWDISDSQNGYTAISRHALNGLLRESFFTYYGYCNDILVKLNASRARVKDVPMPAVYGMETSKIKYGAYIVRVTAMLLRGYAWRVGKMYLSGLGGNRD